MNGTVAPIRGTIKKCLIEYVHIQQARGELPRHIPERELDDVLEPLTERLMTRVLERMNYYLPIILRDEFEVHIKDLIRSFH
jgi:hypothetical protein